METMKRFECDVLVVGGGINGAAIARDAAGRGLRVVLCEKDDLAQHTSSASSKLIHGGLRYLEHYEFGLVRKALAERETLLRSAPHIMHPLRFVMPHDAGGRPAWMIRAGLFLYDRLARREFLPGSQALDLRVHPAGAPLQPQFTHGFMYSDAWVDDARLVVLNAVDACERGAVILTQARCGALQRQPDGWSAAIEGQGARIARQCALPGERRRTLGGALPAWRHEYPRRARAAPDQGQPYRRAAPVRAPACVYLPASGRAHRLRAALRRRVHAGRHHRRRLPGRARQGRHQRRGSALPVRSS